MLTKFILHINGIDYELRDDDLKNWDEIRCSYKRNSYDGVVRSFTSQFEFVNRAYELLMDAYLKDRFNAQATIEVLTINDRWIYETQFACPLDFSTIEWDSYVLMLNAVDNSVAAFIKANKSTKYELEIGTAISNDKTLKLDRIPMQESLLYGFTQGDSSEDSEDIAVTFGMNEHPWVGNKGSETLINQTLDWEDDQTTDLSSYLFKAVRDIKVKFSYNYEYRSNQSYGDTVSFALRVRRNGEVLPIGSAVGSAGCSCGQAQPVNPDIQHYFGPFPSSAALPDISVPHWSNDTKTYDWRNGGYATVNGEVWYCHYIGGLWEWEESHKSMDEYFINSVNGGIELNLNTGDVVFMEQTLSGGNATSNIKFTKSEFLFEWMATGEDVYIGVSKPATLCKALLAHIVGAKVKVHVNISDFDPRIANTYLMAAESIRALPGAKFYSSFDEFCNWMSAVFGYVYYIGDSQPSPYQKKCRFGKMVDSPYELSGTYAGGAVDESKIYYDRNTKRFFYADNGYFVYWPGWENYNDPSTNRPRTDTVFIETGTSEGKAYIFPDSDVSFDFTYVEYDITDEPEGSDDQTIYFVHRSELLRPDADVTPFRECRNLKYSVDTSVIYSTVTVGYDKKDYESVNGRDEFNFNNTYTTGCTVTDKTLSLLSKYRADSYGVEFAIQKQTKDTTDTTSDQDVFFILCKEEGGNLIADRSIPVSNTISNQVFNAAFSPMACILANAGYIGLQADDLTLAFASSTGNSDVIVDGIAMKDDIRLQSPVSTCGCIEFTTDEVEMRHRENDLIEVVSDGILYRGFLKEVDLQYSHIEAAKYKLIVKDIEV